MMMLQAHPLTDRKTSHETIGDAAIKLFRSCVDLKSVWHWNSDGKKVRPERNRKFRKNSAKKAFSVGHGYF